MHKKKRNSNIPTKLTENQFTQFILKHLPKRQRDPISKTPIFKISNCIIKFLYTGCKEAFLTVNKNVENSSEPCV